jgi:glycosyltransferase involved in cell wall biosynthesis
VIYESMAMGVPVIAPALPGNVELMDDECGVLVSPRGHMDGYVEALARFISDADARRAAGEHARAHVRERFSLQQMGAEHGALYEELVETRVSASANGAPFRSPPPMRFRSRPSAGQPLVSVIVPCFNHGRYLRDCLDSIRDQTYPAIETIVVDDASTDPQTVALIEELEKEDVTVLRMPRNGGPSAARNAALDRARGRYILPVDADNQLLPDAIDRLVGQLQGAGEHVGFVYPNLQHFGNRSDYFEAPEYNLYTLLEGNFADTSSLLDREVFDAGLRYPDDIVLGHEDWDFALSLAEREVYGEPARAKTLLYRKTGFTRSDVVEYSAEEFRDRVVPRHRALYDREVEIKARWAPGLSLVLLEPVKAEAPLRELAERQTCADFELVVRSDSEVSPPLRRIPASLARSPADAIETGMQTARGAAVLVSSGAGGELLADVTFVEKLLAFPQREDDVDAIVLADAGDEGRFPLRLLRPEQGLEPVPHGVLWRASSDPALPDKVRLREGVELASFAGAVATYMCTQWRHAPAPSGWTPAAATGGTTQLRVPRAARASELEERESRLKAEPLIRKLPDDTVRRWALSGTWIPPESNLICRHASLDGSRRVVTNQRTPPRGYRLEYDLGALRRVGLPGTAKLIAQGGSYRTLPLDEHEPHDALLLGYVELAPLPLLDSLILAAHRGQHVLIAGEDDPIAHEVEPIGTLGFVDSYPINPRHGPHAELPQGPMLYGVLPLTRSVDRQARRHVYAVGQPGRGELAGELGALDTEPSGDAVPVWITSAGQVVTNRYEPEQPQKHPKSAARWVAAPVAWRGFAPLDARARASAARALDLAKGTVRKPPSREHHGPPAGYLSAEPGAHHIPIHSAVHAVTGDQLLTNTPLEAADMGYGSATLLGYALAVAPLTGDLGVKTVTVPWASRFGHNARR